MGASSGALTRSAHLDAPNALADTRIKNTKPTDKPQRLFDGGGLYLEVSTAGSRLWRLKYRHGGKEKRLALGAYPEVHSARCAAGFIAWCCGRKHPDGMRLPPSPNGRAGLFCRRRRLALDLAERNAIRRLHAWLLDPGSGAG